MQENGKEDRRKETHLSECEVNTENKDGAKVTEAINFKSGEFSRKTSQSSSL